LPDRSDTGWRFVVPEGIPAGAACLDGHFPSQPIVPGAVLLGYASKSLRAEGFELTDIIRMKFLTPLLPDRAFEIEFLTAETNVKITWLSGENVLAQARATLRNHDD